MQGANPADELCPWVLAAHHHSEPYSAVPLRRALGLHRSASAIRTLWECSIPTVQTIRRVVLLQSVSRAVRSSDAGNLMPSLLRDDILRVDQDSCPAYCRPFKHELAAIVQEFPDVRL